MSDNDSIDLDDSNKDEKINFHDKKNILDNCPYQFKDTIKAMNENLNSKLKNHFEEIHDVLNKMAYIVMTMEPKKSGFIIDCRHGKDMYKEEVGSFLSKSYRSRKNVNDKLRANSTKSRVLSKKKDRVICSDKKRSLHSISTTASHKKLKFF